MLNTLPLVDDQFSRDRRQEKTIEKKNFNQRQWLC